MHRNWWYHQNFETAERRRVMGTSFYIVMRDKDSTAGLKEVADSRISAD